MIKLSPGMKLRIKSKPSFATQTLGTLSASMLKCGDDITDETYAERLERNHGKVVWLSADPVVISSRRLPQEIEISVDYGDEIFVDFGRKEERGVWLIAPPLSGDNCRLIRREG